MYQERDIEIVDYELYALPRASLEVRGPAPTSFDRPYIACVGAAQTFGCFCTHPYPRLLGQKLRMPALNLGIAGAGPRYFLQRPILLEYINRASLAVLQVMSARSEDNRLFDSGGLELLRIRSDNRSIGAEPAYSELLAGKPRRFVARIVGETRLRWVASYVALLERIQVPTVLLWFSVRQPAYEETYDKVHGLFGKFPQLVNAEMVDAIREYAERYVECVSSRGLPQQLRSRFTGEPATVVGRVDLGSRQRMVNTYYPSPEMHQDAASMLEGVCRAILCESVSRDKVVDAK